MREYKAIKAIVYPNGDRCWYRENQLHREDGAALEYVDGEKRWYIEGKELSEEEFNKRMNDLWSGKIVQVDGVKYKLVEVCDDSSWGT